MPLSDLAIRHAKPRDKQYRMPDGRGLNLLVLPNGSKYFQLRYRHPVSRLARLMQFGVYPDISLAEARELAYQARKLIKGKIDPIEEKQQAKTEQKQQSFNTFELTANEWYRTQEYKWAKPTKEKIGWILNSKLYPYIGKLPIAAIKSRDLLPVLQRIQEETGTETGKRALRVCGQVWRFAASSLGVVQSDITQELKGQLKSKPPTHRAAIVEPSRFGKLLNDMDSYQGNPVVRAALRLSPLFFCRPGELRQLEWSDVKWDEQKIEIPGTRMKMGNDHVIPICRQAMEILQELHKLTGRRQYVFFMCFRNRVQRPLSENGVRMALNELGYEGEMTPHGFRASARTMLDERLGYGVDLIEHQSARRVRDPLGVTYNRSKHLDARKAMMQGWADYLDELRLKASGQTVPDRALPDQQSRVQAISAADVVSSDAQPVDEVIIEPRQVEEPKPIYGQLEDQVSTHAEAVPAQESTVTGNPLADSLKFLFDSQKAQFEKERQEKEAKLAEEQRKREARAAWEKLPPSERSTPLSDMIAKTFGPKSP